MTMRFVLFWWRRCLDICGMKEGILIEVLCCFYFFATLISPTNNLCHRTFYQYNEGPFFVTTLKGTGKLIGILYRSFYYNRMYPKGWLFKSSGINVGLAPWVRMPTSVFCHLRLHLLGQPSEWRLSGFTGTGLDM